MIATDEAESLSVHRHFHWRSAGFSIDPARTRLAVAANFSTAETGPQKNAIYECGVESLGEAQIQFRSQYYLYAIMFLIFDVEAIFLVPFAVAFTGLPVGAFIAILVFLLLLIEGLIWAWSKGCLQWER